MNTGLMSLLVENHFGVLTRITGLFGRRGYNIKALSVGETENPAFSRITIITEGNGDRLEQIFHQVSKLEEVVAVELLPQDQAVLNELAFIKLKRKPAQPIGDMLELADGGVVIRVQGAPEKIDQAVEALRAEGIVEMSRTGPTALSNTLQTLKQKTK